MNYILSCVSEIFNLTKKYFSKAIILLGFSVEDKVKQARLERADWAGDGCRDPRGRQSSLH